MRVLHLIESLGRGGAEQALVNVLPSLRAAGVDVEVCALSPPYTLEAALARGGIIVHRLDIQHRWDLRHATSRLGALVRRGYDVIHGHSFFPGLYMALARPPRTTRRVITFHSLDYDSYPATTPRLRARKRLEAWLMNHTIDVRLAVSPAVAEHYRRHLGLGRVDVLYNAIKVGPPPDPAVFDREKTLQRFGLSAADTVLLVPSRFVHEKGHRHFIEAFRVLQPAHPRLRALFVGDGPLKVSTERTIVELNLAERIVVRPSVPHADLMTLMAASDMVVLPSTHEGFPLVPAEAMALGRPVVATSVGGVPLLIESEDSGLLVPPSNPAALAAAIERLLTDPGLTAKLARLGPARVQAHFSPPRIAKELEDIYLRALGQEPVLPAPATRSPVPPSSPPRSSEAGASAKPTASGRSHDIVLVDCGTGNLHSVRRKLELLGANVTISADPAVVARASKLVLPGVGHFGQAMDHLRKLELLEPLADAARVRRVPVLGICLGMQLMGLHSEEGPADGLGWVKADVERIRVADPFRHKVPHVGWARIAMRRQSRLMKGVDEDAEFYFVHSYNLKARDPELVLCDSEYAHPFTSAIEHDNLFGVQFHPEKSHKVGERLLKNFVCL